MTSYEYVEPGMQRQPWVPTAQFYGRFESTSLGLYFEDCLMLSANLIQDDNTYFMVWTKENRGNHPTL